jgi:hypothetical protein
MKYERPITYHSKDMANVKSFCRQTEKHTDRPKTISPREHKKKCQVRQQEEFQRSSFLLVDTACVITIILL